jgi:hypothetical protein
LLLLLLAVLLLLMLLLGTAEVAQGRPAKQQLPRLLLQLVLLVLGLQLRVLPCPVWPARHTCHMRLHPAAAAAAGCGSAAAADSVCLLRCC